MKNTKKKGFTVVELVIVIAVIGILSAVLIPTFAGLVDKANKSALQQNLSNAYTTYASSYETEDADLYTKDEVYFVEEGTALTVTDGVVTFTATSYTVYQSENGTYNAVPSTSTNTYKVVKLNGTVPAAFNGYYALVIAE